MQERKSLRLPAYDYSQAGVYFITICTAGKKHILGRVVGGGVLDAPHVCLSDHGIIAEQTLLKMNDFYGDISIDKYVVMPNHVRFIITVAAHGGSSRTPTPTNAKLPAFVSTWKRFTNKKAGVSLWQRSYYDHVIRNDADCLRAWQYIDDNPAKWAEDEYYSD